MEVYVVALLAGAGLWMARVRSQQAEGVAAPRADREISPPAITGLSAGDRPSMTSLYESRRADDVMLDEAWRATDRARRAMDPAHGSPGVILRNQKPDRSEPAGGGHVHSQLLGVDVPIERFTHNNMVPFYRGSSTKQSTTGDAWAGKLEAFTGAFDDVRPLGRKLEVEPLFRPTAQGAMTSGGRASVDDAREAWLQTMPTSRNRANEAPGGLAPEVVGRAGVRGGETGDVYYDMRSYALDPGIDELRPASRPKVTFESRVAGPAGGIAARQAMPVVRERRFEPLTRELGGVDDLLRTTGATVADAQRPDDMYDIRETQRLTTTAPYVGAAGGGHLAGAADARAAELAVGAARSTSRVGLAGPNLGPATDAGAAKASAGDHGRGSVLVYGNNRDVTGVRTRSGNVVSAIKAIVAPLQDALRPTLKDEYVEAPRAFGNVGIAAAQPKLTVYDPQDVARTSLKETYAAEELPLGNLRGGALRTMTYFDPDDGAARTSRKQTTLAETPAANLVGPAKRAIVYDPDDYARTSRKQTTLAEAPAANLRGGAYRSTVYDPDDVARTSRKQTTLAEAPAANLRGGAYRSTAYDPEDVARTNRKETTLNEAPLGNLRGGAFAAASREPGDAARATTRQTTVGLVDPVRNVQPAGGPSGLAYDEDAWRSRITARQVLTDRAEGSLGGPGAGGGGVAGSAQRTRAGAYSTAEVEARQTMRAVDVGNAETAYGQAAGRAGGGGYETAPDDGAKDTHRQTLADHEYYGGGATSAGTASAMSHVAAENMTMHDDREHTLQGRDPTPTGVKIAYDALDIGEVSVLRPSASFAPGRGLERDLSPGRVSALPGRLLEAERDELVLGHAASRRDPVELGALPGGDRFADEVAGARAQRATNSFVVL